MTPEHTSTAVLEVSGVRWASQKATAEAVLSRRPGVQSVDVHPVSQTATLAYDPTLTTVAELSAWIRECGYHCSGQSVPDHLCNPMLDPVEPPPKHPSHASHDQIFRPVEQPSRGSQLV